MQILRGIAEGVLLEVGEDLLWEALMVLDEAACLI